MKLKLSLFSFLLTFSLLITSSGIAVNSMYTAGTFPDLPSALGSAFTYQGRLMDDSAPANGTYNFRFHLWADQGKTTLLGTYPKTNTVALDVVDGYFTVLLDFGVGIFGGDERWLEIEVNGSLLSPLQPLTPSPYAIYAQTAPWSGLTGVPAGFADGVDKDTTYSAGDGLTLDGTEFNAETNYLQQRVDSACSPGSAIREVNQDGTVTCEPVEGGGPHDHLGETWEGVNNPLIISGSFGTYPNDAPLILSNSTGYGVVVESAKFDGMWVDHAGGDGLFVCATGTETCGSNKSTNNGVEIGNAEDVGVYVDSAGSDGLQVNNAVGNGVYVRSAGIGYGNGVYADKFGPDAEWGIYTPDKLLAESGITANALTIIAQVAGSQSLTTGDMVSASGAADPLPDSTKPLPLVSLAVEGTADGVIGVVEGRMERIQVPAHPDEEQEGREPRFTMRSTEGPAQPGDLVAITVLGISQVKVAPGADIQPGQRLTASSVAGFARALRTESLNGMPVTEGAPVIGIALAAPEPGSETIPVFVSLH